MLRSIRWRIGVPYVLLILAAMTTLGLYLSNFMRQTYLDFLENKLRAEARLASGVVAGLLVEGDRADELDDLAKSWAEVLDARVTIIDNYGIVVGESHEDRAEMENHLDRLEVVQAIESGQGTSMRFSRTLGVYLMYLAVPVVEDGQILGFMRVALPIEEIETSIQHLQNAILGITLLTTIIAILLAIWIAGQTIRPLRNLTGTATQISDNLLDRNSLAIEPIHTTSSDEIGQLTRAFNHMAIRLHEQIEALETERSKMAAVLGVMTDGVVIVDSNGTIQLINPSAESMFDVTQENVLGASMIEALRDHQIAELWQRNQESGERTFTTIEIGTRNIYLQGIATSLGAELPGSTLLLFQNLTRLKRLETVRQDFISNISHELRTPLASLKALTETLQEGALDDPPAAKKFLERMDTEVDALSMMVSELLELARIESGRVPLKMAPTSPCAMINQAIDRLGLQADRAGIDLRIDCREDLPKVLADENRLVQVLVNILHNAIKFTPQGGEIRVEAQAQENEILFIVRDSGVGIPANELGRIFERFYKTDRARSSGGTGLGLAISRHLVESHGGEIWAESIEGKGSSFYFTIPQAD